MMSLGVLNLPRLPVLDWAFGHSIVSCHVEHHLFPKLSDHMCLKVGAGRAGGAGTRRLLESRGWVRFSICLNTESPEWQERQPRVRAECGVPIGDTWASSQRSDSVRSLAGSEPQLLVCPGRGVSGAHVNRFAQDVEKWV